jgi:hypothetical protein
VKVAQILKPPRGDIQPQSWVIQPPLPSWGNLAADGMEALNPVLVRWWLIAWPLAAGQRQAWEG